MTDRDRLIELFEAVEKDPAITCPHYKTDKTCDTCKYTINNAMCNHLERKVDYLLANGVIVQQQGKWKIKRDDCDFEYMMCSCCKEEFFPEGCVVEITPNFCPNCGAKMKEREGK